MAWIALITGHLTHSTKFRKNLGKTTNSVAWLEICGPQTTIGLSNYVFTYRCLSLY